MLINSEIVKHKAIESGFNLVGMTRAVPSPTLTAYLRWVEAGMYGKMGYMARPDRIARRQDLNVILPGVQSMVVVGLDYRSLDIPAEMLEDPSRGRFANYAWNLDYHDILTAKLENFAVWLAEYAGRTAQHRVYVDTGAILERSHAQQAGLGFIGKNTMLIHPRRGSYFFLGEILTDLEFDAYDEAHRETMCGSCTRCLQACPTNAFPKPYVLDAGRCISYLTIEHKGWIDHELRPLMGNWVFGCDVCQDVCPWQRFALLTHEQAFYPIDVNRVAMPLVDLLRLNEAQFRQLFYGSPVYRIRRGRLVRNVCIAAANWADEQLIPLLTDLLQDDEPGVRGHAAWALHRITGQRDLLTAMFDRESEDDVRRELAVILEE